MLAQSPVVDVVITESRPTELLAALHDAAVPELEHVFANRRAEPADLVLVAWLDRDPVGYLVATLHSSGIVEVWEHAVAPEQRHRGIGRTLLYELARRVPSSSLIRVDPAHQFDPERASDYYHRCGFSRVRATDEILATVGEVLRATGRSPAGHRGAPVQALLAAKGGGVLTIRPDSSVRRLVEVMNERRIGAMPVTTDGARVEGIVSERDVLRGLAREGADILDRSVASIMTTDTVTCTSADGIELAMSLMTRLRIRHLPVTEGGALVGIVSIGDVVRHRLDQVERENEQIREYIAAGR